MKELLYLIGPPGVGKTTALRSALDGVQFAVATQPFAMQLYHHEGVGLYSGVQLGGERRGFGGTDTLGMNVVGLAEEWLKVTPIERVVAEGDRLANDRFFTAAINAGWDLTVWYFAAPWDLCAERRLNRCVNIGTAPQNQGWLQGRHTKCENLAARWCNHHGYLDGCASREWMAEALKHHSVIRGIRGDG